MALLIAGSADAAALAQLAQALARCGVPVAAVVDGRQLLQDVVRHAPQALLICPARADDALLLPQLSLLAQTQALPVLLLWPERAADAGADAVTDAAPAWVAQPGAPAAAASRSAEVAGGGGGGGAGGGGAGGGADTPGSAHAASPDSWVQQQLMAAWPWQPDDSSRHAALAAALAAALPLAQALFSRLQAGQQALAAAQLQLDERKWVDRAKGLLMRHQQLDEPAAFALLRSASMQANLRVGQLSRGLIEAAESADAVNRAGQLRMLSQRLVKAQALLLDASTRSPVERQDALQLLADGRQRATANLERLAALKLPEAAAAALAEAQQAWRALCERLPAEPELRTDVDRLAAADAAAEQLLATADRLTAALEDSADRRGLHIVNLCGRQRMLSQRLAKQALLAALLPAEGAVRHGAEAPRTLAEFDAGLLSLERAPLSNDDIRSALALARGQWQRLRQALSQAGEQAHAVLARESEALLASFEHLTSLYEHNLQVLMG